MPLEKTSAEDVFIRLSTNKHRIYPSEKRGRERLFPYAQPAVRAGFSFTRESKIFATGSCFARNVEKSLHFIKANVVSSPLDIPAPPQAEQVFQLYNKYTVHSILNEFRWALSGESVDHSTGLVADKHGRYYDLQVASSPDITGTKEEMTAFRTAYNASFGRARDADVVIITLGLVECWFDSEIGVYLNMAPSKNLTEQYPGRFEFHLLDYNDIHDALVEIEGLLRRDNAKPPHILVTVSPVGLASTFREEDVLVANCYSKSVQRAAVEAFTMRNSATYFPSYEYVTLTDRKFAWGNKDFRHVRQETVDRIMADVLLSYVGPSPEQELLYIRGHAQGRFDNDEHDAVIALIEPKLDQFGDEGDLLWLYARSLRSVGRQQDCLDVCRKLMLMDTGPARSAGRTAINTARMIGAMDQYQEFKDAYREAFPDDSDFLAKMA